MIAPLRSNRCHSGNVRQCGDGATPPGNAPETLAFDARLKLSLTSLAQQHTNFGVQVQNLISGLEAQLKNYQDADDAAAGGFTDKEA